MVYKLYKNLSGLFCVQFGFVKAKKFRDSSEYLDCRELSPSSMLYNVICKPKQFFRAQKGLSLSCTVLRGTFFNVCYAELVGSSFHCQGVRVDEGLTLETSALESLNGGQLTLSTQLIKPSYLVYSVRSRKK